MVLLATFASLRFGEVTALQLGDLDLDGRTVRVRRAFVEVRAQGIVAGPPKSAAGRRTVSVPPLVMVAMREHQAEFVGDAPAALVFTAPKGGAIRRGNFRKLTAWAKTVAGLGLAGLHFHDLRHTGNTLAAMSGVITRDLMARMGHDSMRAAIIYQHATTEQMPGCRRWRLLSPAMTARATSSTRTVATTMAALGRLFLPDESELVARVWPTAPIGWSHRPGQGH